MRFEHTEAFENVLWDLTKTVLCCCKQSWKGGGILCEITNVLFWAYTYKHRHHLESRLTNAWWWFISCSVEPCYLLLVQRWRVATLIYAVKRGQGVFREVDKIKRSLMKHVIEVLEDIMWEHDCLKAIRLNLSSTSAVSFSCETLLYLIFKHIVIWRIVIAIIVQ